MILSMSSGSGDFFLKYLRFGKRLDPARDWLTLLSLAGIILAGSIVWNAWAFDTVANGGVIGTSATITPPVFSTSSLDAIHAVFEHRASEEAKYVSGAYRYADPSQ